ncbi:tryptophan--tRNA ligase, partial [Leuconostoc mesenteroides]|nr:tryptophan--tRNA ligase [Leuconostoc mesenteroides]
HQAADILFCKANLVPVGKDQLPHIEITRVIARRFDERYGRANPSEPVFRQPDALLSAAPNIPGLDGPKMSKSTGNTIELRMSADETAKLIKKAKTDSDRVITYDPVNRPEVSNLVLLTAMCAGESPEAVAERLGDAGGGGLK